MTSRRSGALFELPANAGAEPFEERDLKRRTNFQSRAPRSGADFKAMAITYLLKAGATVDRTDFEIDGLPIDALVSGPNGRQFLVLARGTPTENKQSGLRRTDTVEKMGFMAMQLARRQHLPILVVTSDVPRRGTKAGIYLAELDTDIWDVIGFRGDLRGFQRLKGHLAGAADAQAPDAPWRAPEKAEAPQLFDEDSQPSTAAAPAAAVNESQARRPRGEG